MVTGERNDPQGPSEGRNPGRAPGGGNQERVPEAVGAQTPRLGGDNQVINGQKDTGARGRAGIRSRGKEWGGGSGRRQEVKPGGGAAEPVRAAAALGRPEAQPGDGSSSP